jgi:hypothetical protein
MTIVKYEKVSLNDEERVAFEKAQRYLNTIAAHTADPILKKESEELARKLQSFCSRNTINEVARYGD